MRRRIKNASEMGKDNEENQEQSDGELHREQEGKKSDQEQKPQNPSNKEEKGLNGKGEVYAKFNR